MTKSPLDSLRHLPSLPLPKSISSCESLTAVRMGIHNLWSIMHTVGLEDELRISLQPEREDIQLRCDAETWRADQTNLVYRAAAAVSERMPKPVGLDIQLRKRIPMGAGLGGGSSDAAATLVGLNHLLQLEWSMAELAAYRSNVGQRRRRSFFLLLRRSSPGEVKPCRPVRMEGGGWVVLVNPGFGIDTKWAYQATRSDESSGSASCRRFMRHMDGQTGLSLGNRFVPRGKTILRPPSLPRPSGSGTSSTRCCRTAHQPALLSGSGATVFGLFDDQTDSATSCS